MTFNRDHQQIRNVFQKYWFLLTVDPILGKQLSPHPSITYRSSRSNGDRLTSSHFSETPLQERWNVPLWTGECCGTLDVRTQAMLRGGNKWQCKHYVDCNTKGIMYFMQCPYSALYVGKTRREFTRCIFDQTYAGSIGYFRSPLGRHIAFNHGYKFEGFPFLPLERIHIHPKGGVCDGNILRAKTKWIFKLRTHLPPGLNENIYKPFL